MNPAAMPLLVLVVIVARVSVRPFVAPGADPFVMTKGRIGADAPGEDVCLRSLPPELPGVEFQSKWRMCEPWELEAKMRRARAGDAAVPPRPGRE